jgi:hypothetical protein
MAKCAGKVHRRCAIPVAAPISTSVTCGGAHRYAFRQWRMTLVIRRAVTRIALPDDSRAW